MTIDECCMYHIFPNLSKDAKKCELCVYDETNRECPNYRNFHISQLERFYNPEAIKILRKEFEKRLAKKT